MYKYIYIERERDCQLCGLVVDPAIRILVADAEELHVPLKTNAEVQVSTRTSLMTSFMYMYIYVYIYIHIHIQIYMYIYIHQLEMQQLLFILTV